MNVKARELPTIYFGEDAFYVDARTEQFRLKDFPYTPIDFKDLFLSDDFSLFLYYDRNKKRVAENLKPGSPLPEHVSLFRLATIEQLEPVCMTLK